MAFVWTNGAGGSAANIMHFRATTATALFTALNANVTAAMWGFPASAWSISSVNITPLDGTSPTVINPVSGVKWTGTGGADSIPSCAAIVKETTNKRGKSYRGRIYLPNVGETSQTNGALVASIVLSSQAAWDTFYTAMSTATCIPAVASYKFSTAENVVKFTVEGMAGTQRRRQSRLR